jgi:putative endonuclease
MYYVYIMANEYDTVLYVGFTSNIALRNQNHKTKAVDGFTKKYSVTKLVYFECGESYEGVLEREKQIKKWARAKKEKLIDSVNPGWRDLTHTIDEA